MNLICCLLFWISKLIAILILLMMSKSLVLSAVRVQRDDYEMKKESDEARETVRGVRQAVAALSGGLEKNQVMLAEERQGWALFELFRFVFLYLVLDLNFFPKALSSSGTDRVRVKEPSDSDLTTRASRWGRKASWYKHLTSDGVWQNTSSL